MGNVLICKIKLKFSKTIGYFSIIQQVVKINMRSIIEEIINTPSIVIENEPNDEFPEFVRLRRTHTMSCLYCNFRWGAVAYDGISRVRVCQNCKNDIIDKVSEKHKNLHSVLEKIKNK